MASALGVREAALMQVPMRLVGSGSGGVSGGGELADVEAWWRREERKHRAISWQTMK